MTEPDAVRVQNPFARIVHWSQVAVIGGAWLTEDGPQWRHGNHGCFLAARLSWGAWDRVLRGSRTSTGGLAVARYR